MSEHRVLINGQPYHVWVAGSGQPIVLLHGFTGTWRDWGESALIDLATRYHVIAPDLLGHGNSATPSITARYAFSHIIHDVVALCDQFTAQPLHWVGYSMGGRIALGCAISAPERCQALILESASAGLKTESERLARQTSDNALADKIEKDGIASFINYWEKLALWDSYKSTLTPLEHDALHRQRLNNHPAGLANSLRGYGTGVQPSYWEHLSTFHAPTLLICGEKDLKFKQIGQEMNAILPNSHLEIIEKAGHTPHREQSELFWQHVRFFFDETR